MKYLALVDFDSIMGKRVRVTGYNPKKFGYVKAGGWEQPDLDRDDDLQLVLATIVRGLQTNKQGIAEIEFRFSNESDAITCEKLISRFDPDYSYESSYRRDESSMLWYFNFYPQEVCLYPYNLKYRMTLNSSTGGYVTHLNNPWCEVGLR